LRRGAAFGAVEAEVLGAVAQLGFALQPRGLRLNATSTSKLRAWHFEHRNRVQACFSVTFQPTTLARDSGAISRWCLHWRQVTQITYEPAWSESLSMALAGKGMTRIFSARGAGVHAVPEGR
jgi:hypothetical protein